MLKPGYYLVLGETTLHAPEGPYRIRLHREDWLVTNGVVVGRFDKDLTLEWLPLEWTRGHMVTLDEALGRQIDDVCIPTTFAITEGRFRALVMVDEEDLVPDMPRPPLREGLGTYLRTRRKLLASGPVSGDYDFR
jgi:hypothetical protein